MKLDILYASTTGNAEMVAKKLLLLSKEAGFQSRMYEMNDFDFESFSKLKNVAIVTSTYGDGDVPDMGIDFWKSLEFRNTKLVNQNYGLIALGDRSHDKFCGAGRKISMKLDKLESNRIIDRLECDGGTEGTYEWSIKFIKVLKDKISSNLKMSPSGTCETCNNDSKKIASKLKNRDPKDINFNEAKKIFRPLTGKSED